MELLRLGAGPAVLRRLPNILPKGGHLPCEAWNTRHQMVIIILWAHTVVLPIYALGMGTSLWHSLAEGAPIALMTWIAQSKNVKHSLRMSVATIALVTCSAILVHISGGLIEMHFHFFVVVGIVTLYQSWTPFLLAIGYVVLHHGSMGTLLPHEIYNHADAVAHPWKWALIHGSFILAMSGAGLAAWKFAENAQERAVESERKHFEEERRRLAEREQATIMIQEREEQLRQAQKMEAVGHLAGGIAHDFNNLLGVVVNYGRFVAEELHVSDPRRADVEEIIKAGERGARLTRQLLTFSRKEVVRPEVLDLNLVVADTFNILSRTITERIELTSDLQTDLWTMAADRGHVEQVLMNLVVNARDAIDANTGQVVIQTSNVLIPPHQPPVQDMTPGEWVRLSVSDTGSGIPKEIRDHIFEPFFTTKPVGEGTGLGLATVYGIVTQSGGHIAVESEPGHGTTFVMYFPRSESLAMFPSDDRQKVYVPPGRGTSVLVVEDEDAMRDVAARILTRHGFDVTAFASPDAALGHFHANDGAIDVLLTDVVMPEMSGTELSEATGLPTVFMSGYTRDIVADSGASVSSVLQKPFGEEELLDAVHSLLHGPAVAPAF